jgi:hypothetical protein
MEPGIWAPFSEVLTNIKNYLPSLLAGIVVVILGVLVAWIGAKLLVRVLLLSRLDRVIARLGWSSALEKGDVRHSLSSFAGLTFGIIIFLVFLDNAILIWRLTVLSRLLDEFLALIPRLLGAGLVLLAGWSVAAAVGRSVRRALDQEEVKYARLAGRVVYAGLLIFTAAMVLVQLGIARGIVTGAFLLAFGALALAFALAVGLGSRRAVEAMCDERMGRGRDGRPEGGGTR